MFGKALRPFAAFGLTLALSIALAQAPTKSPDKTVPPAAPSAPVPNLIPNTTSPAISADQKKEILDRVNDVVENTAFVPGAEFEKWPTFLAAERSDIDKARTQRDFAMAVDKALHKFGLSHIVLVTPDAVQSRKNKQSIGIGVMLQAEADGMRIQYVFADSPAEEAGLVRGDLIIEGDGKKPQTPIDLLGDEGTDLKIKVKHLNGKTQDYTLTRRKYSNVRQETLTWPDKDTAVLTVHTFDVSYSAENVENLLKQAAGAKNLIVDLRSNPGGSIMHLMHLMGLLLPPDTPIGTFITRSMVDRYVKEEKGKATDLAAIARWSHNGRLTTRLEGIPPFKGHEAVLINGGSGSAAEIAAAALQDEADAPVVGTRSAGAVLVSVMQTMPDGFALQYPITDFVTPNGVRLEGTGVKPLVETSPTVAFDAPDDAVQKAEELLERADLRDARAQIHP